jgi:hypothetical protein
MLEQRDAWVMGAFLFKLMFKRLLFYSEYQIKNRNVLNSFWANERKLSQPITDLIVAMLNLGL